MPWPASNEANEFSTRNLQEQWPRLPRPEQSPGKVWREGPGQPPFGPTSPTEDRPRP